MDPVRLAVIGAGGIGARHVALALAEPACELAAIVDPAPEAAKLAAEAGIAHFADHEALLATAPPEGAIVATPNATHLPVGLAFAKHGIPILVEKPIAETVAAGAELVAAAEAAGVALAVGHMRRFDPAVGAAKAIIESGEIGRLVALSAIWAIRKPDAYFDVAWRRQDGGGPVLLNLIHDLDMLRYLAGDIESVYAETSSANRGFEVEDTAAILLRFESGALGTVTLSDAAPSPWGWERATGENPIVPASGENCYRFLGDHGALDYPGLDLWRHAGPGPGGWDQPIHRQSGPELSERASLADQLAQFCRVVRGLEAPKVSGADGLASLAATMAVLESARRGEPVKPSELG